METVYVYGITGEKRNSIFCVSNLDVVMDGVLVDPVTRIVIDENLIS